jgi:hypothetical protein
LHDGKKITFGLIVFLGLATYPAWYMLARGGHGEVPALPKPPGADRCVESKEFMRAHHMELLDTWRDSVVREGRRTYVSRDFPGQSHEMSLSKTCLRCHADREKFCDHCHSTLSVAPSCWECHDAPRMALQR